jgi:hypothetical protein
MYLATCVDARSPRGASGRSTSAKAGSDQLDFAWRSSIKVRTPRTVPTHDDPILTGKIALAHMKESPDFDERLERMESEAVDPPTETGAS